MVDVLACDESPKVKCVIPDPLSPAREPGALKDWPFLGVLGLPLRGRTQTGALAVGDFGLKLIAIADRTELGHHWPLGFGHWSFDQDISPLAIGIWSLVI